MAHSPASNSRPYWSQALRALREARGITQDGWATQLGYGRATVRRWEAGQTVPSADAERAIIQLCREKDLMRRFADGPLAGVDVTPDWIADLIASARLGSDGTARPETLSEQVTPPVHYALSDSITIAYQIFGDGPHNLIVTPGAVSHREVDWEYAGARRFFNNLAAEARVIIFDKRGTGMSDRVEAGTLEQRVDDIRAVMDAENIDQATLLGISEGAPMSVLFAATYPDRIRSLVLYGAFAGNSSDDEPPPPLTPDEEAREIERIQQTWGRPESRFLDIFGPSVASDPAHREWWARYQRMSASPGSVATLNRMNLGIDVRHVLPAIRIPTLVVHRIDDRAVDISNGRFLAEQIPDARMLEIPGEDHIPWMGDIDTVTTAVTDFMTGTSPQVARDTVLASILSIRFAGITASEPSTMIASARRELGRYRGREVRLDGKSLLATFDGPSRAVHCAGAIRDAARTAGYSAAAGIHTGEIEILENDVSGDAVQVCADLADQAHPGEILVTRTVTDLVAGSGLT
ncbi:MAG: alpha/beta fold hydrolase, partial [Chloroflexota bacterium]